MFKVSTKSGKVILVTGANKQQVGLRGVSLCFWFGRVQAVPACDQLPECLSLPAHFRPATERRVVTTFRTERYVNRDAGAIPAASIFDVVTCFISMTCVYERRGQVTRHLENHELPILIVSVLLRTAWVVVFRNRSDLSRVPINGRRRRNPGQYPTTADS